MKETLQKAKNQPYPKQRITQRPNPHHSKLKQSINFGDVAGNEVTKSEYHVTKLEYNVTKSQYQEII